MPKSKKEYEEYLNLISVGREDFYDYLAVHCGQLSFNRNCQNQTLGRLIRRYDPIAFETGFNEWRLDK